MGGKCVRADFGMVGHGVEIAGGSIGMRRCIVNFVAFVVFEVDLMDHSEMSKTSRVLDLTLLSSKNRSFGREMLQYGCVECLNASSLFSDSHKSFAGVTCTRIST